MTSRTVQAKPSRRTREMLLICVLAVCLVPLPFAIAALPAGGQSQVTRLKALLVRPTYTQEFGVARPTDIAFDAGRNALVVAAPESGAPVISVTTAGDLQATLPPVAIEPRTLAFDRVNNKVAAMAGDDLLRWTARGNAPTERVPMRGRQTSAVSSATLDRNGALLLLDARARAITRIDDVRAPQKSSRLTLTSLASADLRGITVNPVDGLTYVGDPAGRQLHGFDAAGNARTVIDISDANLPNPQSFTFAPSADPTDDPQEMSLYITDSGGATTYGQVAEMTLLSEAESAGTFAALAVNETAQLVNTINTATWNPPSPDPSGVVWTGDRLEVVDSEVEEMGIWRNANMFESTTAGGLLRTGNSTPFSNEPTGVSYRASDNTLLISDDNANRITFLKAGADARFGTADDNWTFLNTLPLADDAEDVAWDAGSGHVWIIDGVATEVFRVNPVDGIFGNGNDVWTNFDVGAFGARDPEGIEYNPANDSILVSDGRSRAVYEVSKSGAHLRTIDVSGAGSINAASVALAPGSVQPGRLNLYLTDRGVDNNNDPNENDGRVYEMSFGSAGSNNPPVVQSVTINQASPNTNDTLTTTVVATDPDNDPLTHSYQWFLNGNAINGATNSALDLSVPGNGDGGDQITVRVTTSDGQVSSAPVTSAPVTIATSGGGGNTPPTVQSVTIDQTAPRTNDTLTATVVATDPDGDPLTYSHQWRKNGVDIPGATSPSLNLALAGNGDKGEQISVRVGASDGQGGTGSAPTIGALGATYNTSGSSPTSHALPMPAGIVAGNLLIAVFPYDGGGGASWPAGWTELVDRANSSHGLAVAYRVATGSEGATVTVTTPAEQAVGWVYRITNWSGTTPPQVTSAIGSDTAPDPPSLTPSWSAGDTLWLAAYGINGGGSSAGPTYPLTDGRRFARTGGSGSSGGASAAQVVTAATYNPGAFSDSVNSQWVAATIAVRAGGAGAPSSTVTSAAVTVADTPPVFSQNLADRTHAENAVINLAAGAVDADGDALTYAATGLPTGLSINTSTGAITGTIALGAAAQSPYSTSITVRQGATPDATDTFTWTVTAAPVNAPPTVQSVTITPTSPRTNDVLTASVTASDPNGDALTYAYQWLRNGSGISGANASTLDLSQTNNGNKGDAIAVRVTANDGQTTSTPVTSASVTIVDSPPAFSQDLANRTNAEGASISLSAGAIDPDGDALTYAATGLPTGLSINTSTGAITGTIALGASAQSPYSTSITVRQGATPDATDTFTWTVTPPVVAAPQVAAVGATYNTAGANVTSHPIPLPTGIAAGDLLVAVFPYDGGTGVSWPAGWVEIVDRPNNSHGLAVAYRTATGTEGTTVTVTTVAEQAVGFVYRITGWAGTTAPQLTSAIGSSATPDPPLLTPTGGNVPTLWMAAYGINGGPSSRGPSYPMPDNRRFARTGGSGAAGGAATSQTLTASSLDPPAFSDTENNAWVAVTIAIR